MGQRGSGCFLRQRRAEALWKNGYFAVSPDRAVMFGAGLFGVGVGVLLRVFHLVNQQVTMGMA